MATTTNYGWTTPDDTALVKDGAAAIRTLGTSVDTTTKNLNPSTTLGDIEYRSSTANTNTRLGIGSTGNVLTVAGGVPTWATPVSSKVLQVVNVTKSDVFTTTSTSLVDVTGLSVSITPTLATSKILVMTTFMYSSNSGTGYPRVVMKRNSTTIFAGTPVSNRVGALNQTNVYNTDSNYALQVAANFIDEPATTSALTYKIQALQTSGNTVRIGATGDDPDSANFGPRFASSIVLLEIGA
jgi:hypothetical protein